ncbi:hypothetical protein [Legionella sp. W05-934-2]|jgi:hypothetical protein|uniref:hypothetical protein n=1 Tax=Legionella sp. W05-934-2 TaxID=1198649 RepID=UPI003462E480
MKRISITSVFVLLATFTKFSFAAEKITVEVFSDSKNVAAIGYTVNNKEHGDAGSRTRGKGPANATYHFGLRCGSLFGEDISCGSLLLTTNSKIRLTVTGKECTSEMVS